MASWEVVFVVEDLDSSSYEAVGDAASAVYVGAFHYDAVLHLGVGDGGIVSDAGVGADVGVGAYLAVVADDGRAPDGSAAVDYRALAYADGVGHRGCVLDGSVVVGLQLVED